MSPRSARSASWAPGSNQPQAPIPASGSGTAHWKLCKMPVNSALMKSTDELKSDCSESAKTEMESLEILGRLEIWWGHSQVKYSLDKAQQMACACCQILPQLSGGGRAAENSRAKGDRDVAGAWTEWPHSYQLQCEFVKTVSTPVSGLLFIGLPRNSKKKDVVDKAGWEQFVSGMPRFLVPSWPPRDSGNKLDPGENTSQQNMTSIWSLESNF